MVKKKIWIDTIADEVCPTNNMCFSVLTLESTGGVRGPFKSESRPIWHDFSPFFAATIHGPVSELIHFVSFYFLSLHVNYRRWVGLVANS